ncbi:MAG: hypothetical protein Q7S22_06315 [Candidatus Micrarchaeota archaeon]|nr:hypothetical protein [Candidatus Micrarchaeota archaeon]
MITYTKPIFNGIEIKRVNPRDFDIYRKNWDHHGTLIFKGATLELEDGTTRNIMKINPDWRGISFLGVPILLDLLNHYYGITIRAIPYFELQLLSPCLSSGFLGSLHMSSSIIAYNDPDKELGEKIIVIEPKTCCGRTSDCSTCAFRARKAIFEVPKPFRSMKNVALVVKELRLSDIITSNPDLLNMVTEEISEQWKIFGLTTIDEMYSPSLIPNLLEAIKKALLKNINKLLLRVPEDRVIVVPDFPKVSGHSLVIHEESGVPHERTNLSYGDLIWSRDGYSLERTTSGIFPLILTASDRYRMNASYNNLLNFFQHAELPLLVEISDQDLEKMGTKFVEPGRSD